MIGVKIMDDKLNNANKNLSADAVQKIEKLWKFIQESENIVFFGGAGVSTESGIPDFRSKDGLYNQHDVQFDKYEPEYLLSNECLFYNPKVFYEFYRQKLDVEGIEPNITHKFLAKLEENGKLSAVVTQNIDGLHQKAGSKKVLELHGTTLRNYCVNCKKELPARFIFESESAIPRCPECKNMVRPDVTLYGESLPQFAFNEARKAIRSADMIIIAGTSLTVQPAAGMVYGFAGKHMAVINRDPLGMPLNAENDVVLTCSMGDVFGMLYDRL